MKKEEHSKKVQQIIEQKPAFIVRWGNLILLILLTLLGGIYWVSVLI